MISSTVSRNTYVGTGVIVPLPYTFKINKETDLLVIVRNLANVESTLHWPADFSVQGVGASLGGTITPTVAVSTGSSVEIRRVLSLVQSTDLKNQGAFFPDAYETALDNLIMITQQIQDQLNRSIRFSESYDPATLQLALGLGVAGQSLVSSGNGGVTWTTTDSGAVALPGAGRTVPTLSAYISNNTVFNVKDFGAVGDGVTNDTLAFNKARQAQINQQGGAIYAPTNPSGHSYLVDWLDERGTGGVATDQPYVLIGDDKNRTQIQQTDNPNIMLELGKFHSLTGCRIEKIWFTGNPTCLGAIRLGSENFSVVCSRIDVRVNNYHSAAANAGYGAYGISLDNAQQTDLLDTRIDACYNCYFRPNWGTVEACEIHGHASDISHADNCGIQFAGEIADMHIHDVVIENCQKEGIHDVSNPGVGTVAVANSAGFPATFSTAQTGFIGEKGYFVSGGHMYLCTGFDANKLTCTTTLCITGGPNFFAAAAFRYEFRNNITIDGATYIEANCIAGGLADIAFQGSSAPNAYVQVHIGGINFHSAGPKLFLDHVGKSTVRHCTGLSFGGSIVTTANARVHFSFNGDNSATDMTGVYAALAGAITWEELDRTTGAGGGFALQLGGERYYASAQRVRGLNASSIYAHDTSYENAGAGIVLADGAVVVLAAVCPNAAVLEINETASNGAGSFWINVAGATTIWQTSGVHFAFVKDTAGKVNIYVEGGALKIQNKASAGAGIATSIYGIFRKFR